MQFPTTTAFLAAFFSVLLVALSLLTSLRRAQLRVSYGDGNDEALRRRPRDRVCHRAGARARQAYARRGNVVHVAPGAACGGHAASARRLLVCRLCVAEASVICGLTTVWRLSGHER